MLARYPNDPDASCSLGSVLVDQGRFDEIRIPELDKAVEELAGLG